MSLLKKLWFSSRSSHSPLRLHKAIVRTRTEFVNAYSQQDSHELLMFLLDALHEDLNRVRDKPYIDAVEDEGRPDRIVAEETWSKHLLRNRSIVVDYCTGQFKSAVTCPSCERVSVNFEPFTCATLPMISASQREIKLRITLKPRRGSRDTIEIKLPANSKIRDLKHALAQTKNCKVTHDCLYVVELYRGRHHKVFRNKNFIRDIEDGDVLLAHEFLKPSQGYRHVMAYTYILKSNGDLAVGDVPAILSISSEHCSSDCHSSSSSNSVSGSIQDILREYREAHLQNEKDEILGLNSDPETLSSDMIRTREDFQTVDKWLSSHEEKHFDGTTIAILVRQHDDTTTTRPCTARDRLEEEKKTMTLSQCLTQFAKPEKLDEENKWYCSKCKDHFRATKRLEFWTLPDVLIVHLKRFKYRGGMGMFMGGGSNKISTYVDFPTRDLDMTPYVLHKEDKDSTFVYDLYAVTNHYGRSGYGHYTSFARDIFDSGSKRKLCRWNVFDDEQCRPESDIKTSAAYLLFYLRRPSGITDVEDDGDDDDGTDS